MRGLGWAELAAKSNEAHRAVQQKLTQREKQKCGLLDSISLQMQMPSFDSLALLPSPSASCHPPFTHVFSTA